MVTPLRTVPAPEAEEAALAHAPLSFEEFYEANRGRLFVSLCLVTGSRYEAEEVMQEAFVRLWERWDRMSYVDDPTAFLFRTAMNVFRNRYRRAGLALRRTLAVAPADDDLSAVEDRDEIVRLLKGLIPQQRAAIVLTALLGFTSEEAGRMLGMRASTVRVLSTRARASLRQGLKEPR